MVTAQFAEIERVLSADVVLMRRTRRIVRVQRWKVVADRMLEGMAALALLCI
jgi:hypothetical protein